MSSDDFDIRTCALTSRPHDTPSSNKLSINLFDIEVSKSSSSEANNSDYQSSTNDQIYPSLRVDLIVLNEFAEVLLELKHQHPGRGYWHTPGRTIRKCENIRDVIGRILLDSLGITRIASSGLTFAGVVEDHFHQTLPDGRQSYSHCIALAYRLKIKMNDILQIPRTRHTTFCWMPREKLAISRDVLRSSRAYANLLE